MATKDELLDRLTELYKQADDECNCLYNDEQTRFFYGVLCNAYSQAFARLHTTFYPTIPAGAGNTILIQCNISLAAMQAVSVPVAILQKIAEKAADEGIDRDLVHIITDNDLLTAYLIEPHMNNRSKEIHCSKSIYNTTLPDETGNN